MLAAAVQHFCEIRKQLQVAPWEMLALEAGCKEFCIFRRGTLSILRS